MSFPLSRWGRRAVGCLCSVGFLDPLRIELIGELIIKDSKSHAHKVLYLRKNSREERNGGIKPYSHHLQAGRVQTNKQFTI